MLTTKKMMADIQRLNGEDVVVCSDCGSDAIEEKIWVDANHYVMINGESYFQYSSEGYDEYRCRKCMSDTIPISLAEYKEEKDAK